VSLHSHLLDVAKRLDSALGIPLSRTLPRPARRLPDRPHDVLFIRLWGLGNLALMAGPLAAARKGRVRLLTLARNQPFVASQYPWVETLALREPPHPTGVVGLARHLRALADAPPDVVIDCEQFLRLPTLAVRALCPAPIVGLDTPGQGRARLLDRAVAHDPTRHVAETFAVLAGAAGLSCPDPARRLFARARDREGLRRLLPAGPGPLVVLHPGSGDHFPGRRWPAERFAMLAERLAARPGARLALTGLASERRLTATVAQAARLPLHDLTGRLGIGELIALLEEADLLVTNDTGPMHLAACLETPTVALFGPNTPHRYGPRNRRAIALFADLPCSPCLDDRTMKRSSCRHHSCMEALDVESVTSACRSLLAARGGPRQPAGVRRLDAVPS
jgi:ADP-heptose:LPS heptosyltransferase